MLPRDARLRRSEDVRRTVRRGVRAGRRTVVVHALRSEAVAPAELADRDVRVGFVVSKAVGSAVRRNRVRRRLRHLSAARLPELERHTLVVVRALPPSAAAGPELADDLAAAWSAALSKLARR